MNNVNRNLKPLSGFANWAYDIREVVPGFEQVSLYRDNISRFVAPVDVAHEKLLANLKNIASEMEFDIQRKLSQRLYGFDFVAQSNDVFADVANVNIRRFLVGHAVSLKNRGRLDCGVRSVDAPEFLDIIDGNGKQILEIVSYLEKCPMVLQCAARGGVWMICGPRRSFLAGETWHWPGISLKTNLQMERGLQYILLSLIAGKFPRIRPKMTKAFQQHSWCEKGNCYASTMCH